MFRYVILVCTLAAASQSLWCQNQGNAVVMNAASFQTYMPSGGALATVFCPGAPSNLKAGLTTAPPEALPYQLAGFNVLVNSAPAPIAAVYVSPAGSSQYTQINFQVPTERNSTSGGNSSNGVLDITQSVNGSVAYACGVAGTFLGQDSGAVSGGFFADANGYAIARHASDYSQVTTQNPAHAGETIIAYGTDFFSVWPPPPIAIPVSSQPLFQYDANLRQFSGSWKGGGYFFLQQYPSPDGNGYSIPSTPPLVTSFLGLAPGMIGVEQINFVVPSNQVSGDWALFYNIGTCNLNGVCESPGFFASAAYSSPYVTLPVR
ncbi:MAG TPA: hypothetical protein VML19_04180 [Verrucomicrobiae bacterium]|nr:hypothetical protein [Verrucomicrobiae bacterium]